MNSKVWFITGASRGMGRIWAEAALTRGDKVAVTARNVDDVADMKQRFGDAVLTLTLDVAKEGQAENAVQEAFDHFGRLDVVINNAAYALVGMVEEAKEADIRALFDTNYFGTLRVIQAALPLLRKQGSGHIIGVSSTLGIVAMPLIGFYAATKWAVEALHESLATEVKAFGLKVTLIEPGAYATDFGSPASFKMSEGSEAYSQMRTQIFGHLAQAEKADPGATAQAVLTLVDAEEPPLRFILGNTNLPLARKTYASRLATWEAWEEVSNAAQGEARQ